MLTQLLYHTERHHKKVLIPFLGQKVPIIVKTLAIVQICYKLTIAYQTISKVLIFVKR